MINPELPDIFCQVIGLVSQVQIYRPRKSSRMGSAITAAISLLLTPVLFIGGLAYALYRVEQNGEVVFWESFLLFLIGAVLAGLVSVAAGWGAFSNWNKALVIYQNGFAYNDRGGLRSLRWDELDSITAAVTRHYTNGVYTGTTHSYTMRKRGADERITINDSFEKVEEAANHIRDGAYPSLFKNYVNTYNTGAPISFGEVILSRSDGITIGKKNYPWDQVKQVSINQGIIAVARKDGGWFSGASVAASQVPNLELMLSIVDNVVGIKTK